MNDLATLDRVMRGRERGRTMQTSVEVSLQVNFDSSDLRQHRKCLRYFGNDGAGNSE
jgi:hypothetical protein